MAYAIQAPLAADTLLEAGETARLEALDRLDILDTPREDGFDGIVRLMRRIFNVPVASVSLIDAHRQWFKACEGMTEGQAPRADTFCNVTIGQAEALVVEDALLDPRFSGNPFVTGAHGIRFYAGLPLRTRDGHNIGTLCVMDTKPRTFTSDQLEMLVDLGRVAMAELNLRQHVRIDLPTGLLSRRALIDDGDDAVALARRHEMELSCIAIGIDCDAPGDAVMEKVAVTLRRNLRRTDIIGRTGSRSFAVVLPNTGARGAFDAAEKVRGALSAICVANDAGAFALRVNVGVAALDSDVDDLEDLLARAESILDEATRAGGTRTLSWQRRHDHEPPARRRVLKAGTILFNGRHSTIDCTIRSLSGEGAGLDVSSTIGIPEEFQLLIRSEAVERKCRAVARSERHLEVEFR